MLKFGVGVSAGPHPGGWRHPDAWPAYDMDMEFWKHWARTAERGMFDMLFMADGLGVRGLGDPLLMEYPSPVDRPTGFEPFTFMAAMSQHTTSLGLVATGNTTYEEPFHLARRFASVDHLSHGRAGWNVVTGAYPDDALNFSRGKHVEKSARYARSREAVEVAKGLWDGWADDAFLYDKKSGRYLDAGRFRTLDHDGEFFQVRGPLNIARPPQGHPVLFLAGQSEDGREMAAAQVDCVFASTSSIESSTAFSKDIRDRLDRYNRAPGSLKVFTPMTVYLGSSDAEAQELVEELSSLISPELGVANLSKVVHMDLSAYPLDGPMPEPSADWDGIAGIRDTVLALAKKDNLSIRQTYERVMSGAGGGNTVIGSASTVADRLEEWDRSGASDGLMIGIPVVPKGLDDFVDQVVPELQRRGILRKEYAGSTLRENLELATPPSRFFGK